MLFGDKTDFAIEAMVEPELTPPSAVWGRMRVWCQDAPLGDFDDPFCALYPAYLDFWRLSQRIDRLWTAELQDFTDEEIFYFLDRLMWGDGLESLLTKEKFKTLLENPIEWGLCNFLTDWGEQFDGTKAFILNPPGDSLRILCRELPPERGIGVSVSRKGFLAAAAAFDQWYEEQKTRLSPEDGPSDSWG